MRNPVTLIQAAFYEADWGERLNYGSFSEFIDKYDIEASRYDYQNSMPYRNIQFYSLGVDTKPINFRAAVESTVNTVMKDFDAVLIQERFLESLVLMRITLNWSYDDVAALAYDTNPANYDSSELTEEVNRTINLYNAGTRVLVIILFTKH